LFFWQEFCPIYFWEKGEGSEFLAGIFFFLLGEGGGGDEEFTRMDKYAWITKIFRLICILKII